MTPEDVQALVHAELASLGGHLLGEADKVVTSADPNPAKRLSDQKTLAMLGGFLLKHYGNEHVTYRDPEPPAVGEPPTTTPGSDT